MANHNDTKAHTSKGSGLSVNNGGKSAETDVKPGGEGTRDNTDRDPPFEPFQSGGRPKKDVWLHKENKEHRHERFERKHDRREAER
jgi:hypothetical protein